jgi:tetratricopeptide (TPR) repeat protein
VGKYNEAREILLNNHFPLCEGKMLPRILFEEICEYMGKKALAEERYEDALKEFSYALEYQENLGTGKPDSNMEAKWHYFLGKTYNAIGDSAKAIECFKNGMATDNKLGINFFPLKDIVWEHEEDMVDTYLWENRIYIGKCQKACGVRPTMLYAADKYIAKKEKSESKYFEEILKLRRIITL